MLYRIHKTMGLMTCIPDGLSTLFQIHGRFVARHPLPYLLVPIILTVVMSAGLYNIDQSGDAEYLYVPTTASSLDDRDYFQEIFPDNHNGSFTSLRETSLDNFVQIHVQPKIGDSPANPPGFKIGFFFQYTPYTAFQSSVLRYDALKKGIAVQSPVLNRGNWIQMPILWALRDPNIKGIAAMVF